MTKKTQKSATGPELFMQEDLRHAFDFDPKDPMAGLTAQEMSGSGLNRRTVLRLLAAQPLSCADAQRAVL